MDLKKVLNALNTALPTGTFIGNEELLVHHIPSGRSFSVQEAVELTVAAFPTPNFEILGRTDSDTEQTLLVRLLRKEVLFIRTRENKDAEWHDWQIKAEI